ncbi:MAG: hypothetical protein J5647_05525 [Spirochaetaceae bacterium]|nr:hypothetical protein [Spirochaetaceae bacterium]
MYNFEYMRINSISDLKKILTEIAQKEKDGKFVQIQNKNDLFCTKVNSKKILDEKKFPDFIRYYFKDLENKDTYLLSVETYHGIGGEIKKLDE